MINTSERSQTISRTASQLPQESPQHLSPTIRSIPLFLIFLSTTLRLLCPPKLLAPILPLLPLLSACLLNLGRMSHSNKSVSRLELLHSLDGVVDQSKACGLATTVLGAHAEDVDLVGSRFVDFGEFGTQVVLGDIGAVGVEDVAESTVSMFWGSFASTD